MTVSADAEIVEATLALHRTPGVVRNVIVSPRLVCYDIMPARGVRVESIIALTETIAAALGADGNVRAGRSGSYVRLEVPRDGGGKPAIALAPLLRRARESGAARGLGAVLGLREDGAPLIARLASPTIAHILVSGTTGSGKTALLRTILIGLAATHPHSELRLVLIDPKGRAFGEFSRLPYLPRPVITDPTEAVGAIVELVRLVELRDKHCLSSPAVVVFIDELTDLAMVGGDEMERALTRLAQRGREAGVHIVAATQKPSAAVIGTLVRANFPARLVGKVTCAEDAHVASGQRGTGAERLLGRGDFLLVAEGGVHRFQAAYVEAGGAERLLREFGVVLRDAPPAAPRVSPALPRPASVNEVDALARRLRDSGWTGGSVREACRLLGEAEGGRRYRLVQAAVRILEGDRK